MLGHLDKKFSGGWVVGGIAIIVTCSRLQVTLRVETCVELELSLPESDLEPSLLITDGGLKKHLNFYCQAPRSVQSSKLRSSVQSMV